MFLSSAYPVVAATRICSCPNPSVVMSVAYHWCLPFSEAPVPAICSTAAAASPPSRRHHRRSLSLSRHRGSIRVYGFGELGFLLSISTASPASSNAAVVAYLSPSLYLALGFTGSSILGVRVSTGEGWSRFWFWEPPNNPPFML